jgi:acetyltransferase-like isoleucine patch superfamily enzyme
MLIGSGTYIHPSVHILGKKNIRVGSNTCLSEGCWLNINQRVLNKIAIAIGSNCFIGKQNFFSSGDIISIGDYTLTTIGCRFIGSTHKIDNPDVPYLLTGTTNDDQIIIGVNCFFGAGTMVLGNVKIGHGSVIGANSLVLRDIPPFSIAIGNPAQVSKRYSFVKKTWLPLSEISFEDELCMPNEQDYLRQLKEKFPSVSMPWIAAGKSMGDL